MSSERSGPELAYPRTISGEALRSRWCGGRSRMRFNTMQVTGFAANADDTAMRRQAGGYKPGKLVRNEKKAWDERMVKMIRSRFLCEKFFEIPPYESVHVAESVRIWCRGDSGGHPPWAYDQMLTHSATTVFVANADDTAMRRQAG